MITSRMLARSSAAARASHVAACCVRAPSTTFPQSRSFLTSHALSKYWMKRAKILHLIGRMVMSYPQMHYIPDPDAPINQLFARGAGERERAFMFVLSQVPPDEPIDLEQFVRGASDAARTICSAIYDDDTTTSSTSVLETMALANSVDVWKQKVENVRKLLGVPAAAAVVLETVEMKHVGVAEVNYTYSDAHEAEEQDDPLQKDGKEQKTSEVVGEATNRVPSKFMMHEAIQIKVCFDVREHLRVLHADSTENERSVAVDSTFEWTFESDVSRDELVDWVITSATPFSSTIAPNDDTVDDIAKDIEGTL